MRLTPSVAGFGSEYPAGFRLECMAGFVGTRIQLELALLKGSNRFDTLRKQLLEITSALEDQTAIPAIAHYAELIEEVQTDQWWEGVTVPLSNSCGYGGETGIASRSTTSCATSA